MLNETVYQSTASGVRKTSRYCNYAQWTCAKTAKMNRRTYRFDAVLRLCFDFIYLPFYWRGTLWSIVSVDRTYFSWEQKNVDASSTSFQTNEAWSSGKYKRHAHNICSAVIIYVSATLYLYMRGLVKFFYLWIRLDCTGCAAADKDYNLINLISTIVIRHTRVMN